MTHTKRFIDRIPPPTIQLFVRLSIISAIGIMALALVSHWQNEDGARHDVHAVQHPPS
jgi:hypothetical protein